jgi:PAS domain S-box-containing protein
MQHQDKSKEQLAGDLMNLRQQIAELEAAATRQKEADEALRQQAALESQQAEASRRDLAEKYQAILASIGDGYFEVDLAGNLTFCNEAFCALIGRPIEEFVDFNYRQYMGERTVRKLLRDFNQIYRTGEPAKDIEYEINRTDGTLRFVATSASLIKNSASQPVGFRGIVRDITERKQCDQLRLMELSIEHAGEALFWLSPELRFVYVNKAACLMLGYTREELLELSLADVDKWFAFEKWPEIWQQLKGGDALTFAARHRAKDGRIIPVEINANYLAFNGQEYSCAFVRDTTERKRVEQALRASEQRFSQAFNASPIPISISTLKEARFIDVNESFIRVMGYSREELIGRSATELNTWVNFQERQEALRILKEEGTVRDMEMRARIKGGEIRWFRISIEIIELDGEQCVLIATNDITERKQAEAAYSSSEEPYLAFVTQS